MNNQNLELIVEVLKEGNKVDIVKDDNGNENIFTTGKTIYVDAYNQNNRKYPSDVMQKAIDKYKAEKMGKYFTALGELNHPLGDEESMVVDPNKASHKFVDIWKENDNWFFTKSKVLNTQSGKVVKELIKEGISMGISSRGFGEVTEDYEGRGTLVKSYTLITPGDYVMEPSAPEAFLDVVKEGRYPIKVLGEKIIIEKFKNTVDKNWKVNNSREINRKVLNEAFNTLITEIKK